MSPILEVFLRNSPAIRTQCNDSIYLYPLMNIYIMSASSARPDVGYHWNPTPPPPAAAEMLRVCSESDKRYSCVIFRTADDYSVLLHNMIISPPVTDYLKRPIKCNCLVTGLGDVAARRLVIAAVKNESSVSERLANQSIISVGADDFTFDAITAEQVIESLLAEESLHPIGFASYPLGICGYRIGEKKACSDGWLQAIRFLRKYRLSDRPGLRVVISEFGVRDATDLDLSLELSPTDFCQALRNLREIGQAVFIGSMLAIAAGAAVWRILRQKD